MALLKETLQAELTTIYEKGPLGNPDCTLVGIQTAKAYLTYCATGQNAVGQSMIAMPGSIILGQTLGTIFSAMSPAGSLTAVKMASAFELCLLTFMSTFQLAIVPGPFKQILELNLNIYLNKPSITGTEFASNFAMALHLATTAPAIQVSGIAPGLPPIPFTGPIS